jgi:hypothetical protein
LAFGPLGSVSRPFTRRGTNSIRSWFRNADSSALESAEESAFLNKLLIEFVPRRVKGLLTDPSGPKAKQLGTVFMLTATIGCGYLYGILTWD